jgi:hypothetical protein
MNGGPSAPLEGNDESSIAGFRAAVGNAEERTLGQTLLTKWKGDLQGGQMISQQDAVAQLKQQNYDTNGVPEEGMTEGALLARMNRASYLRQTEDIMRRSHMGTTSQVIAGIVGQLGDPLNVVLAPAAEVGVGAKLGLGARAVVGASEGVIATNAYERAQNYVGKDLGDPDINSAQMLKDMMFGAGVGGILHSSFGPRPVAVPGGGPVTLNMIDTFGERSDIAAKHLGVPVDELMSPAGAVGRYQIMPETGRQYGLKGSRAQIIAQLKDPKVNAEIGQKILDDLNTRYKGDPEAVAIAYNAGPGVANRFIRSGRDYSVLPAETRGYVARMGGMPRDVRVNGAQMAMAQAETDSPIDVKPTIDKSMEDIYRTNPFKIQDEHDNDIMRIETEAFQRTVPKQDSLFTQDPDIQQVLRMIDARPLPEKVPDTEPFQIAGNEEQKPTIGNTVAIDPELSQHVTNDVRDAKQIGANLGDEKALFEEPEPHTIDGMPADEHQKAVDAAVRCGLLKGGF